MSKDFEKRFDRFAGRLEKFLIKTVLIGMALLIVVQIALTNDSARVFLNYIDRLEGSDYWVPELVYNTKESVPTIAEIPVNVKEKQLPKKKGFISIKMHDFASLDFVKIIINDDTVTRFSQNPVMLEVSDGDLIKIDGSAYQMPIKYEVVKVSEKVVAPQVGLTVKTNGNIAEVNCVLIE